MIAKKVLLVGGFGVGKTSLIKRFVTNVFSTDYISTIGVRVSTKTILLEKTEIKLLIWDIEGTNGTNKIPKAYFLGASAILYVFDVSRESTYKNIEEKIAAVLQLSGQKKLTVVGNKKDLLTTAELQLVKDTIPIPVDFITSAKEDGNVNEVFNLLASIALKQ
jgi:small GTP-binding protein